MYDKKSGNQPISTKEQSRPHEAYPELVSAIRMIEMHDGNPIWLTKVRDEIDTALATERNASYKRGYGDGTENGIDGTY